MQQSKRQQRKAARASKTDKWGFSMSISRTERRRMRKLSVKQRAYNDMPINRHSGHKYSEPGSGK